MIPRSQIIVICSCLFLTACGKAPADPVISVESNNAEMNTAIARARSEVDNAIQIFTAGAIDNFSVKVPITDGNQTEHFWLRDVTYANGEFTGIVDNDAETVKTVKRGDKITVKKNEISDWLYMKDGKMHGNYTLRVLFKQMPPDEVARFKKLLAE